MLLRNNFHGATTVASALALVVAHECDKRRALHVAALRSEDTEAGQRVTRRAIRASRSDAHEWREVARLTSAD